MASLIARSPLEGVLPVAHGALTLSDATPGRITSVAPLRGKAKAVDKALSGIGLRFPAANRVEASEAGRIVWTAPGQAFLINGDPAPLAGLAALSDQTDGWVGLRLDGPGAEAALARLVPIDLRPSVFAKGAAARAPLNHMMAVVMRAGAGIEILTFRSMAKTAVHEIETAMASIAARG